jgi:hypothetical protein
MELKPRFLTPQVKPVPPLTTINPWNSREKSERIAYVQSVAFIALENSIGGNLFLVVRLPAPSGHIRCYPFHGPPMLMAVLRSCVG